jgi:hypothetical protein
MDVISGLLALFSENSALDFAEDFMELPSCPLCNEGKLLPLSDANAPYALWACSAPNCAYAISKNMSGYTFYKGVAKTEQKQKGMKTWVEYEF